ncbi:hypothetical protein [Brevifollis gellanilyticus]|uniref:Uncharacterized protein n=1 Tax=Brevifollis gellanilyticus TaxID=748831 RepID=A0A512MC02_9BACT|nr:hypothetical protein [Brevifollis gellanilyticus]GEP43871.1 hypothetical protein BGE01nite_31620 [Brevifollis gellanilyticus]
MISKNNLLNVLGLITALAVSTCFQNAAAQPFWGHTLPGQNGVSASPSSGTSYSGSSSTSYSQSNASIRANMQQSNQGWMKASQNAGKAFNNFGSSGSSGNNSGGAPSYSGGGRSGGYSGTGGNYSNGTVSGGTGSSDTAGGTYGGAAPSVFSGTPLSAEALKAAREKAADLKREADKAASEELQELQEEEDEYWKRAQNRIWLANPETKDPWGKLTQKIREWEKNYVPGQSQEDRPMVLDTGEIVTIGERKQRDRDALEKKFKP